MIDSHTAVHGIEKGGVKEGVVDGGIPERLGLV